MHGNELAAWLRHIRTQSGSGDYPLASLGVQQSGDNGKVFHNFSLRAQYPGPSPSRRALFLNPKVSILFRKYETEVGSHLQRPPVVEGSNYHGWRVAKILERVVGANPDLAGLVDVVEQRRKPGRYVYVAHGYTVVGVRKHVTPY